MQSFLIKVTIEILTCTLLLTVQPAALAASGSKSAVSYLLQRLPTLHSESNVAPQLAELDDTMLLRLISTLDPLLDSDTNVATVHFYPQLQVQLIQTYANRQPLPAGDSRRSVSSTLSKARAQLKNSTLSHQSKALILLYLYQQINPACVGVVGYHPIYRYAGYTHPNGNTWSISPDWQDELEDKIRVKLKDLPSAPRECPADPMDRVENYFFYDENDKNLLALTILLPPFDEAS